MADSDAFISLAKRHATARGLLPHVVCAICERESSWDPWAIRYEPDFQRRYVTPLGLDATASVARSISWGLMQVMGQSAREVGYAGPLPALCDPANGLEWGCRLFAEKLKHAEGNYQQALNLWNGGDNPAYAPEVLAIAEQYRQRFLTG